MSEVTFGNPLNANTKYRPLARSDIRENPHKQVLESIKT